MSVVTTNQRNDEAKKQKELDLAPILQLIYLLSY